MRAGGAVHVHVEGFTRGRAADGETELVRHSRFGAFYVTKFALRGRFGGARVTKFALLAKKRAFWAVLRMQGEFCPAARLEADAELVELSGEMSGLVAALVGGQRHGRQHHGCHYARG